MKDEVILAIAEKWEREVQDIRSNPVIDSDKEGIASECETMIKCAAILRSLLGILGEG